MAGGFINIVWVFLMKELYNIKEKGDNMNLVEAVHEMFSSLRKGLEASCIKPKSKKKAKKKTYKKLTKKKAR